jgi:hypothetical protein
LSYPYFANEERSTLIKNEYTKILIGDPKETVLKVLPAPDEILDLYNLKIYPPKIIGKTYWFIIQRKIASGSVIEKDEKLVRVSFNLQEKVTAVDHWGF